MEPKKILALVEKFRKDDERIEVCELTYSDFENFTKAYPDMKGIHYYNKWLIVSSPSKVHEILCAYFIEMFAAPLKETNEDLTNTGGAKIKFRSDDPDRPIKGVRCPDGSYTIDRETYPRIVLEVSFTHQSYENFVDYLMSYLTDSAFKVKYALGIFCRAKANQKFRIEFLQVYFENGNFVVNRFELGNDSKGMLNSTSPSWITFDLQYLYPERTYTEENRFLKFDLQDYRKGILVKVIRNHNIQDLEE